MIHTLLILSLLAANPDGGIKPGISKQEAQEYAQEAVIELDAILLLDNTHQKQILLSAVRCESENRVQAIKKALYLPKFTPGRSEHGIKKALTGEDLKVALRLALSKAEQRVSRMQQAFIVYSDMAPISCSHADVSPIVDCLSPSSPYWCSKDPKMQAWIRASQMIVGRD